MIEWADLGYAVEGAPPEVVAAAGGRSDPAGEEAVDQLGHSPAPRRADDPARGIDPPPVGGAPGGWHAVGDSVKRWRAGCGLALALLLTAACGGQSSSAAPSHGAPASASPSPSAEPTAAGSEATVHAPVLPSLVAGSASYATASDAARFVSGNGLAAVSPEMTWRPAAALHVIHATGAEGAGSQSDWYFFFARGKLVGQQFFSRAAARSVVDAATFAVTYNVSRPGNPHCCSSGGQAPRQVPLGRQQLVELDPIPGGIQT